MKIGYDAKRAFLNGTGLGNYSRWLIKAMSSFHTENQFWLYTPKIKRDRPLSFLNIKSRTKIIKPTGKYLTSWWRTKWIVDDLKKHGIELYHGLSHELPLGIGNSGIKSVVTMHDLIFMRFPEYFGLIDRVIYSTKLRYACKTADRIVAISQQTKNDLVSLLKVDPTKIEVIYQGCNQAFGVKQTEEKKTSVKQKYQLPDQYILTVGTIEERKNLLLMVKALPAVHNDIPLVVVGKPTHYLEQVKSFVNTNGLGSRVIFLHQVTFADLPAVYQMADVFVYPSRYEGFGIPVLEALNSGVPVVAAKGSCLEEAGGKGSLYVSPDDHQALAESINLILADDALKQRMIDEGLEHAKNFEDKKLADQLMNLYQATLNHA
jgi:glycosyltransferase involved in cell wall biosynthesis